MSFESFSKRIAVKTNNTQDAAREAKVAAAPFHAAFLGDIYPHWQGPLNTISKQSGVSGCGHQPVDGLMKMADLDVLETDAWFISEKIFVSTDHGVAAAIVYVFGGDMAQTTLLRVPMFSFAGNHAVPGSIERWTGRLDEVVDLAIADVPVAADLVGGLLVQALDAQEAAEAAAEKARIEAEKAAAEAAAEASARKEAAADAGFEA